MNKKEELNASYGLVPSPKDERDLLLSSVSPDIVRYPEECPPPFDLTVLNQQQHPACVGFSLSAIKQERELREKTPRVFDGLWIYKECKKIDGIPDVPGTFFRAGLKVLKDIGAKTIDREDPSIYRIAEYRQIDDMSFEGIKKAIFLYGAVLGGFKMNNSGWRGKIVSSPKEGEKIYGHAVAIIGYEKDYLIGQNSWGEKYHDKGIFKIPKDYLPFEAWLILLDRINEPRKEDKTGWVARRYLDAQDKTTANLNVREQPSTDARVLKVLPKGAQVLVQGVANLYADGYWWSEIKI